MINPNRIDQIVDNIRQLLPSDSEHLYRELNEKIKTIIQSGLKDMELVTREEFDVQAKLLAKTRAKLDELQAQLEQLEQKTGE